MTANIDVQGTKRQILDLAQSYSGQGDPDYSKQRSLDVLIERLLSIAQPPPLKDRLSRLYGTWKQVWGPYDYRNKKRGIDPKLGVDEIYQVVFPGGFYYNVSPLYKHGDKSKERIGLLRGEYKLDDQNANQLRVRFTKYPGVRRRPASKKLWELPELEESGQLQDRITIVPALIVRIFFGKGALREVYTDESLRLCYGSSGRKSASEFLYVMTRIR